MYCWQHARVPTVVGPPPTQVLSTQTMIPKLLHAKTTDRPRRSEEEQQKGVDDEVEGIIERWDKQASGWHTT